MKIKLATQGMAVLAAGAMLGLNSCATAQAAAGGPPAGKKPNILVIFGDE